MKFKYTYLTIILLVLMSCSSDDDSGSEVEENNSDYFPLKENNSWTYQNSFSNEEEASTEGTETMSVDESYSEEEMVYYTFSSDGALDERGLLTGILSTGEVTKTENGLIYNGNLTVDLSMYGLEVFTVPLENVVVYNQQVSGGTTLTSFTDSFSQTIEIQPGFEAPVNFDYTITTAQQSALESYTAGTETYEDVISSSISLQLSAEISIGPFSVSVLDEQEVLSSTSYYANNVGMIYSENHYNYTFEDLSEYGIPDMGSVNMESSQTLTSYSVE